MRNALIVTFIFFSLQLFGQRVNKNNSIEMNTKFVLELQTEDSLKYNFKLISQEPFNSEIDWTKQENYLDSISGVNQIQGILSTGRFGNKINSILLIQSGINKSLNYRLDIKISQELEPINTSVVNLHTNVRVIELWPYAIDNILFSDFTLAIEPEEYTFEPQIDSSCINNIDSNLEKGNELFRKHLNLTLNKFKSSNLFDLSYLINFEDSIKTQDVSLGHYWSLGEGIYPNNNNYNFGIPISYRRLECPYFDGTVNFFYTRNDHDIKVVSYGWKELKENDFPTSNSELTDNRTVFEEKYNFIIMEASKLLGDPVMNIIEENGRRKTKWKGNDCINAYLFNFSSINELRLYIYME